MKILENKTEYENRQMALVQELTKAIKADLEEANVPEEGIPELTENLVLSVTSILDGARLMRSNGKLVLPVVGFAEDKARSQLLVAADSSMHDMASAVMEEMLEKDEEED